MMGVDKECRDALKMAERQEHKLTSPTKPGKENKNENRESSGQSAKRAVKLDGLSEADTLDNVDKPETESTADCTDEKIVYKNISRKNHFLNIQDLPTLVNICREERINCTGRKAVVTKRLKEHFKLKILRATGILPPAAIKSGFDYLIVLDFEATCENDRNSEYPHEIIEFPAVLVDVEKREVVDSWRRYVRPQINPTLSNFCTNLTGIKQETVDKADDFVTVLGQFSDWLQSKKLGVEYAFCIVTDGPFDIARFLFLSCQHNNLTVPNWATRWINVRKSYLNFYKEDCRGVKVVGLQDMLARMSLTFEGTPHSGLDDAQNIAKIVVRLLQDGATFRVNERLDIPGSKERRLQHVAPVAREEANNWLQTCKKKLSRSQTSSDMEDTSR